MLKYHQSLNPLERNFEYYKQIVGSGLLRFSILWSCVSLFFLVFWHAIKQRWEAFLLESHSPYALSTLRIIAFTSLLYYTEYGVIVTMSALPSELLVPPLGWSAILFYLKPTASSLAVLIPIFQISTVLALLGFRVRIFGLIAVFLGIWILGVPQFYGKINHYHHLLWFAFIAVMSPSTEVWALDSLRKQTPDTTIIHRYYLRLVLLSLVVMYFFAGCWKLIGGGADWLWGDAAKYQIQLQSFTLGLEIPAVLINYPILYKVIALLTVLLEISWGWWMLNKSLRPVILIVTLIFHTAIFIIMDINFWILPVFFIVFLPFHLLPLKSVVQPMPSDSKSVISFSKTHWSRIYAAILLVFGFFHIDTWPFAVYPSFGNPVESLAWHVSMQYREDGVVHNVNLVGDSLLRKYLPKTRLLGLHKQLLNKDAKSIHKLRSLDPFYCEALGLSAKIPRTYIKRKTWVKSGAIIDSSVLLNLP